jgi:hypothetical protein
VPRPARVISGSLARPRCRRVWRRSGAHVRSHPRLVAQSDALPSEADAGRWFETHHDRPLDFAQLLNLPPYESFYRFTVEDCARSGEPVPDRVLAWLAAQARTVSRAMLSSDPIWLTASWSDPPRRRRPDVGSFGAKTHSQLRPCCPEAEAPERSRQRPSRGTEPWCWCRSWVRTPYPGSRSHANPCRPTADAIRIGHVGNHASRGCS